MQTVLRLGSWLKLLIASRAWQVACHRSVISGTCSAVSAIPSLMISSIGLQSIADTMSSKRSAKKVRSTSGSSICPVLQSEMSPRRLINCTRMRRQLMPSGDLNSNVRRLSSSTLTTWSLGSRPRMSFVRSCVGSQANGNRLPAKREPTASAEPLPEASPLAPFAPLANKLPAKLGSPAATAAAAAAAASEAPLPLSGDASSRPAAPYAAASSPLMA